MLMSTILLSGFQSNLHISKTKKAVNTFMTTVSIKIMCKEKKVIHPIRNLFTWHQKDTKLSWNIY